MQPGMTPAPKVRAELGYEDPRCDAVLSTLKSRLGQRSYELWFDQKVRLDFAGEQVTFTVGSPFLMNCIQKQFRKDLAEAARAAVGAAGEAVLAVDATLAIEPKMLPAEARALLSAGEAAAAVTAPLRSTAARRASTATRPEPAPTAASSNRNHAAPRGVNGAVSHGSRQRRFADLADFVPGPATEFAVTACRHVASAPGTQFNPLFLYGPVGTGKTHLLEGICRQVRKAHPELQVVLLTAEAFANYFTQALTERTLPSFRQKFRGVDVLLVDDIDFFESKRVFQEEFLHTLGDLADHGRQVVVTADRHPRLLTKLGDDLVSRFHSGLICRLENPDVETRRTIVERKAARLDGDFAPEALQFVAERFKGSVRELEGALNCLQTFGAMTKQRVTAALARQLLADLERDCLRVVRLTDIERVVCQMFGLKPKDLKSDSRVRTLAQPRMLAMFLARKHTQSAYSEIGQHFGGRNHSTVMSAERKVEKWLAENATVRVASHQWTFQEIVSNLEQQLLAG